MIQQIRGNKPLKFGSVERKASLNWHSLLISLVIAVLTWGSTELVPQLQEYGGTIATIAGLVAQAIPMVILWLRNNQDMTVIKESKPKKGKG
jgi:hypothetical protein